MEREYAEISAQLDDAESGENGQQADEVGGVTRIP